MPPHSLSDHSNVFVEPELLEVSASLQSCCEMITQYQHDPEKMNHLLLIQCVNRSAVSNHQKVCDSDTHNDPLSSPAHFSMMV